MTTRTNASRPKRILVDEREYRRLHAELARLRRQMNQGPTVLEDKDPELPRLPAADERGHYPAVATARALIARQVVRGRKAAGWTQAELAARAGVRPETVSRIETGKHSPGLKTMAKIDRALRKAGV